MSSTASLSSKVGASAGRGRLRAVGGQAVCAAAADELTREVADPGGDTGTAGPLGTPLFEGQSKGVKEAKKKGPA